MDNNDTKIESVLKRYRPLGPPPQLKDRIFLRKGKKQSRTWFKVAASILVLLSGGLIWWCLDHTASRTDKEPTFADIEMEVNHTGTAAAMLAVADLLAQQPGGEKYARNRYLYLVVTYPKKEVATLARLRLQSLSKRSTLQ